MNPSMSSVGNYHIEGPAGMVNLDATPLAANIGTKSALQGIWFGYRFLPEFSSTIPDAQRPIAMIFAIGTEHRLTQALAVAPFSR
jgi:hypothetical protein